MSAAILSIMMVVIMGARLEVSGDCGTWRPLPHPGMAVVPHSILLLPIREYQINHFQEKPEIHISRCNLPIKKMLVTDPIFFFWGIQEI